MLAKTVLAESHLFPRPPSVTEIEDIQRLTGNGQLVAIKDKAAGMGRKESSRGRPLRGSPPTGLPKWQRIERFARHAAALDKAKPLIEEMDSLRSGRLLLDDSDPASALQKATGRYIAHDGPPAPSTIIKTAFDKAIETLRIQRCVGRYRSFGNRQRSSRSDRPCRPGNPRRLNGRSARGPAGPGTARRHASRNRRRGGTGCSGHRTGREVTRAGSANRGPRAGHLEECGRSR